MFAPVATRPGAARVAGDVGSSARRHRPFGIRVGARRTEPRRTFAGVRTSRSDAASSRYPPRRVSTVARANAQANTPAVAPAHLRETVTPVPPDALDADGGMSLAAQPGMAAGFGDLTAHDFLRVNTELPGLKVLHIDPPVVTVDDFLTAEQCDALVAAARDSGEMRTSEVGGADGAANVRTSRTCTLDSKALTDHPTKRAILDATEALLPQLAGLANAKTAFKRPTSASPFSYELPQVAHYRGGEYFKTHEDAFPARVADKKGYQRRATVLVYLNDVEKGGATRFEKLGPLDVAPKKGKALLFFPGTGASMPDPRTLHTAVEATRGHEKWISQLWVCAFAGKHAPAGAPPGPGDRAARRAAEKEAKKAAKKARGGGGEGGELMKPRAGVGARSLRTPVADERLETQISLRDFRDPNRRVIDHRRTLKNARDFSRNPES